MFKTKSIIWKILSSNSGTIFSSISFFVIKLFVIVNFSSSGIILFILFDLYFIIVFIASKSIFQLNFEFIIFFVSSSFSKLNSFISEIFFIFFQNFFLLSGKK